MQGSKALSCGTAAHEDRMGSAEGTVWDMRGGECDGVGVHTKGRTCSGLILVSMFKRAIQGGVLESARACFNTITS